METRNNLRNLVLTKHFQKHGMQLLTGMIPPIGGFSISLLNLESRVIRKGRIRNVQMNVGKSFLAGIG